MLWLGEPDGSLTKHKDKVGHMACRKGGLGVDDVRHGKG